MKHFLTQATAALEMARSVGIRMTAERVGNYLRTLSLERSRGRQFARMKLEGSIVRNILGSKMRLQANAAGLDRDLLLDGIREPIATGYLLSILGKDDIVLEVGANIGYYALMEARICKKIYAVEPHPGNFERLKENIALNGFENIEAFNAAFGPKDETLYLQVSELSNWHSCRGNDAQTANVIPVPGYRIDTFIHSKLKPTFMKMDVEGFELEVLKGATETLRSLKHLFLELHGSLLSMEEIRATLDIIKTAGLKPALVAQYDRPGLCRVCDIAQLEHIYAGDRGTYELFFRRPD